MDFKGKKVVVTGAVGVYGREFAAAFVKAGAVLCLSDRLGQGLRDLKKELGLGAGTILHETDLADERSIDDLVATVTAAWKCPDIVVNNAAIFPFGTLFEVTAALWDEVMDVNLKAPFLITRAFGRAMIDNKVKGCFVNLGSSAGHLLRSNGIPYCVSKRGLEFLTQGFALELGPHGIRINTVEPAFKTGATEIPEAYGKSIMGGIPLNRLVETGEVAAAVLFLSSDEASYITGATLAANGGDSITRRARLAP